MEVYFQKENIYTLDSKGELLITIMSSLAQEESRMDSLEKERERKGIQYDIFSGFLAGLSETGWKSERRFKAGSGRGIGFCQMLRRFFCAWK